MKAKRWQSFEQFLDWLEHWEGLPKFVKTARPAMITGFSILIVVIFYAIMGGVINAQFSKPVNKHAKYYIEFQIKQGETLSSIARKLDNSHLIRSRWAFKLYADFSGRADKLKAGTYILSQKMTIEDLLDTFTLGSDIGEIRTVQLIEGWTASQIADQFGKSGLVRDKNAFLDLLKPGTTFNGFAMIKDIGFKDGREYKLEGYLFPDTYEFYRTATYEDIINKMLGRFDEVFSDDYRERAHKQGLTIDEVVILASIVEKEAKTDDFTKVAAVLRNRLDKHMKLQSDATIKYITGSNKLIVTQSEKDLISPYNTYLNDGLPPGPICNPGKKAIEAVLYPDVQYQNEDYLYFVVADPEKGTLAFARTLSVHEQNINKYKHLWEEFDNKNS